MLDLMAAWKTIIGALVTLVWVLLLSGETDKLDYIRECSAWLGGFMVGAGLISADEFFRRLWYRK